MEKASDTQCLLYTVEQGGGVILHTDKQTRGQDLSTAGQGVKFS